jgi:hypothetical protein
LNKIAKGWAVQQDPNDNQTVDLIPSAADAKAGTQIIKWKHLLWSVGHQWMVVV